MAVEPLLQPAPEPVPFVPDPRADPPRGAEVVVVGAGLMGASAAYHLAAAGLRPLVVEANAPASGASGRNAGMVLHGLGGHFGRATRIVRESGGRSILDYTRRSMELLAELDDTLPGGIELDRSGSLDLLLTEADERHAAEATDAQRAEGLDTGRIDLVELGELAPTLDAAAVRGARWTASDGKLNPFRLTYGLLEAAVARGAQVVTGVRVEGLLERGGRVAGVRTSHGEIAADAVLVAANAWTPALVPAVAANLTPIREHVCVTEPLPPLLGPGFETNACNEYGRQMRSGEVLVGGFAVADEGMGIGAYGMRVTPGIPPLLARLLGRLFPELADRRLTRCWTGLLDFASLEVPMVGPIPDAAGAAVPGGYLACGLTGHGMPYAPVLGLLVAELIAGGQARSLSLAPFTPSRYAGPAKPPTWLEPFVSLQPAGARPRVPG